MHTISGLAAVFHNRRDPRTEYAIFPGAYECVEPGAFDRALAGDAETIFRPNHQGPALARRSDGSLRLRVDAVGLHYSADTDGPDADTLARHIRIGAYAGSPLMWTPKPSPTLRCA